MNDLNYARQAGKPRRWRPFHLVVVIALAIALSAIVVLFMSMQGKTQPPLIGGTTGITASTAPIRLERFDSSAVFAARIDPVLAKLKEKNTEAVARAVEKIHLHFEQAKGGAPTFAKSIIGPLDATKTTYLAVKGAYLRWWYEDKSIQPVAAHVTWNYEQHVTSGPKIRDAILAAIKQLEDDFRANRNEALQAIRSSLRAAHLPAAVEIDQKKLDEFCQGLFEAAVGRVNAGNVGEKAAIDSATSLAVSAAVSFIVDAAITRVISSALATAGGTVAGGTATGAAAGSWVPGSGTVIGAAAGFLAGAAIDIWMTHRNETKTIEQVTTSLTQLEAAILNGDEKRVGIRQVLDAASGEQSDQLGTKLKQHLKEASQ